MTDKGIILSVNDVPEGKDVYNPAVLMLDNKLVVWGREESRATPTDATVRTFWLPQNPGTTLEPLADAYIFRGENGWTQEDPCAAIIQGQLVIGVVEVEWSPTGKTEWMGHKLKSFRMRFYAGSDWRHLEPFAEGPLGMKDIRLVDLGKDGIGVYARPKPDIGFTVIPSLNALTPEVITEAPALPIPHDEDEWIGTNAVYRTSEETNLLLLHSGRYDAQGNLDYRAEWLFHNFATGEVSERYVLAVRSDFPDGPAKKPELANVIFPSALIWNDNETVDFYTGCSDAAIGRNTYPASLFAA